LFATPNSKYVTSYILFAWKHRGRRPLVPKAQSSPRCGGLCPRARARATIPLFPPQPILAGRQAAWPQARGLQPKGLGNGRLAIDVSGLRSRDAGRLSTRGGEREWLAVRLCADSGRPAWRARGFRFACPYMRRAVAGVAVIRNLAFQCGQLLYLTVISQFSIDATGQPQMLPAISGARCCSVACNERPSARVTRRIVSSDGLPLSLNDA
jgi:hypothetical protein